MVHVKAGQRTWGGSGGRPGAHTGIIETLAFTLRKTGHHRTVPSKELLLNEWLTKHHDRRHKGPSGAQGNLQPHPEGQGGLLGGSNNGPGPSRRKGGGRNLNRTVASAGKWHGEEAVLGTGQQNNVYGVGHLGWDQVSRGQDTEGLEC